LLFQLRTFGGELLGYAFDYVRHQSIGLLYCMSGLIDERGLDLIPAGAKVVQFIVGK
jgi:hypothetical protein